MEAVNIIHEYLGEKLEYIPHMANVLSSKFSVEKKMKGLHLQMGTAMGAAILSTKGGLSVENAALVFSVDSGDVAKRRKP